MKEQRPRIVDLQKEERTLRIHAVMSMIKKAFKAGRDVDKEKLIAVCMVDMGIARRTVVEYIMTAKALMGFIEDKGILKKGKKKDMQRTIFADEN